MSPQPALRKSECFKVMADIAGRKMAIVMDTGAAHSVISCDRADTLCLKPTLRTKAFTGLGSVIGTECYPVEVMIGTKTAFVPFRKCSLPTPLCLPALGLSQH
jgi:predicted aspartyl protease